MKQEMNETGVWIMYEAHEHVCTSLMQQYVDNTVQIYQRAFWSIAKGTPALVNFWFCPYFIPY